MMRHVLGSRASIGGVLGSGRASATADWWLSGGVSAANAIAVYQPIGAASLAASYTNLANPGTFDAAPGVAPTFDTATGWTFGSGQYLETGVTPANDQTWSMLLRFSDSASGYTVMAGTNDSFGVRPYFLLESNRPGNQALYGNGDYLILSPALTNGVMAIAGNKAYRNGVQETGTIGSFAGTFHGIYIGATNNGFSSYLSWTGKIQAIAIYNTTLTAPQVAAISSAMSLL